MSIITFLSRLWSSVKKLFSKMPADLQAAVNIGVVIVENIKAVADSPVAEVITAIIPGELDDRLKDLLRAQLPWIMVTLKLVDLTKRSYTEDEALNAALSVIKALNGDVKSAMLHNLAVLITQLAADGKLSWSDAVVVVEWYYKNKFKAVA